MSTNHFNIKGLTDDQVVNARKKYGLNQLNYKKQNGLLDALKNLIKDPMIILLFVASLIYFISGDKVDWNFFGCCHCI